MPSSDASTNQAFWAEIESVGESTAGGAADENARVLALARRIAHAVRGFEKIRMLEALAARSSDVALFSSVWAAHFNLGEGELQSAGMLRKDGGGAIRLEVPPNDPLALLAAGRVLVRQERFDEALRVFQRAAALRPDDIFAATWVATTLATLGRHDEADEQFAAIGRRVPWPCAITRLSTSFWRGLDTRIDAIERESGQETTAPSAPGGPVTLISCDRRYFLRYSEAYVRAWVAHGPRAAGKAAWRLHIHVVSPDDECRKHIAAWQGEGLPVVASEEALPGGLNAFIRPGSSFERRTFYACARLRVLPRLLAHYRSPIIMTDMDLELSASPAPIWPMMGEADAGLIRLSARVQPYFQEFYLALAVFRPTDAARRFAAMLAAYVEYFLDRRKWIWGLDQAALYSASGEAARSLPAFRCAPLPIGFVGSANEPSDSALFRHHVASQA